ncbi:MAG TPA: helix-turn-helix domain-containing protein [Scandinavium sp.]|jgi:CRP-like cAMP-binding protein
MSCFTELTLAYKKFVEAHGIHIPEGKGELICYEAGEAFDVEHDHLYILSEGIVAFTLGELATVTDYKNEQKNYCIGNLPEGMMLGLIEKYAPQLPIHYVAETTTKIVKIDHRYFDAHIIKNKNDVNFVIGMLSMTIALSIDILHERSSGLGYETIRAMIIRCNIKKMNGTLSDEPLSSFILRRTRLSRSYVFRIIADLKKGGYITVIRGRLYSINRILPEKY